MIFAMTDEILWWGLNVLIQYFQTQSTKGIVKPKNFVIHIDLTCIFIGCIDINCKGSINVQIATYSLQVFQNG